MGERGRTRREQEIQRERVEEFMPPPAPPTACASAGRAGCLSASDTSQRACRPRAGLAQEGCTVPRTVSVQDCQSLLRTAQELGEGVDRSAGAAADTDTAAAGSGTRGGAEKGGGPAATDDACEGRGQRGRGTEGQRDRRGRDAATGREGECRSGGDGGGETLLPRSEIARGRESERSEVEWSPDPSGTNIKPNKPGVSAVWNGGWPDRRFSTPRPPPGVPFPPSWASPFALFDLSSPSRSLPRNLGT